MIDHHSSRRRFLAESGKWSFLAIFPAGCVDTSTGRLSKKNKVHTRDQYEAEVSCGKNPSASQVEIVPFCVSTQVIETRHVKIDNDSRRH